MAISLLHWQTVKVMNREEEIAKAALECCNSDCERDFFTKGVKWADSHLSEELVRRLYSASIAIYKLGRCKSDNEAILYIKERFKL